VRAATLLLALCAVVAAGDAPNLAHFMPPAGRVPVKQAIEQGVEFLVKNQNKNGSFGKTSAANPYQLWCDVPGGHQAFQAATTALCWMGLNDAPYQTAASLDAQKKCLRWLVDNARVKRAYARQFYNVWSFGYGLRALGQALRKRAPGAPEKEIRATMEKIVKAIEIYQSPDGGWGYLDFNVPAYKPTWSTSFTTATILVGINEAQKAGVAVPPAVIEKATKLMRKYRTPDGNYLYSIDWKWRPAGRINRPQGSSMRNQSCNLALALYDSAFGDKELRVGLDQLEKHHRFATAALRRPVPHESHYAVSGYFYLYGQQYAAVVLERMSKDDQKKYWPGVVRAVLKTRQPDGSFWDYPTYGYHKYYGTGYALMALSRCPEAIAKTILPAEPKKRK
jgi:hypothetical protein